MLNAGEAVKQWPSVRGDTDFPHSALVNAYHRGINAVELDALAHVIGRLSREDSTIAPSSMHSDLHEFAQLGYVNLELTSAGTLTVSLVVPSALLSAYFWSVWIPRHLHSNGIKAAVMPHLPCDGDSHQVTVVFRVPGQKEATRTFLHELACRYPGSTPEVIAIQAGNALQLGGEQ